MVLSGVCAGLLDEVVFQTGAVVWCEAVIGDVALAGIVIEFESGVWV